MTIWLPAAHSADSQDVMVIRLNDAWVASDPRLAYKQKVLAEALEVTKAEFGPYEIRFRESRISNERAIQHMEAGGPENVFFGLTSNQLERRLTPIRVPVRMGIHNYRLLLIHKDDQSKFGQVKTLEQLKQLKLGVGSNWMMRKVVEPQGFPTIASNTYEGLFKMLETKRFDYTVRGVHEIFVEMNRFADIAPNIMIEPTIILHNVAPFYFFVSPHEPELTRRLTLGFNRLAESGHLRDIFLEFNDDFIDMANIENRHIIHVPNQLLPEQTPLDVEHYWIWPATLKLNKN
ncbi:transporter substrate-binding domain-containing protein [Neiella marina]|uniref:Transporter substrate-binding domain-containing protein n=1 Tax=Neiella holothuriorum TaxID=2870530 RepID=A0ABS7EFQ8_9GAMM|nr:transporter substrate-binding domain-containing protein [Neiella holothuriorum]MBW8191054.1 transporter substrate-binding domain-containing protein [Neiella holothuriorum]